MAKFIWQAGVFIGGPLFAASTSTQVTVVDKSDDTLAGLWADRDGTSPKANPFFISSAGKVEFYADAGRYSVTVENGGFSQTWDDVVLIDPDAGGGGGGGGGGVTALSIVSGAVTVNLALGNLFTLDMTENVTDWVFTNKPGAGNGGSIMIRVTQGSPARTLSLPAGSEWTDGSRTTLDAADGQAHLLAMTSFDNWATVGATMGKLLGVEPPAPDLIYLELNNIDELYPGQFLDLTGEPGVLELNV